MLLSCVPNTEFGDEKCIALKNIKKGEYLTNNYFHDYPQFTEKQRKEKLFETFGFHCCCVECLKK